jgi:hypothetical protein
VSGGGALGRGNHSDVMARFMRAIYRVSFFQHKNEKTWIARTSRAMTT